MMRLFLLATLTIGLSGCVTYLENPRDGTFRVASCAPPTTDPLPERAYLSCQVGSRSVCSRWTTFGIDASAITDASGTFSVSAQLNDRVRVIVQDNQLIGDFQLPPFPPSNRIEGILWKLSRHKPPISQRHP
jgi:hypothetical protein